MTFKYSLLALPLLALAACDNSGLKTKDELATLPEQEVAVIACNALVAGDRAQMHELFSEDLLEIVVGLTGTDEELAQFYAKTTFSDPIAVADLPERAFEGREMFKGQIAKTICTIKQTEKVSTGGMAYKETRYFFDGAGGLDLKIRSGEGHYLIVK